MISKVILKVRKLAPDAYGRPRLQNVETNRIYVDVALGDPQRITTNFNIPGDWHTCWPTSGEPECPFRSDIEFELIEGVRQ